ncbi:MAG: IS1182 family transposase, partial [Actinomycetota bacterium]
QTRHVRRHLVTKGSFYERLADHGDEVVSDEDFAGCYSPTQGRPSIPPSVMMRALLCAANDRITSDAETSRRTRVDADWKAAMGVDDDFEGIAPRTFSLFRARLVIHDADETILRRTVDKAVEAGILRGKLTALIDSSPVHGAGAVADTYELVRKLAARLARAAGEDLDADLASQARALGAAKPDIDWDDAPGRRAHLDELVSLAVALLVAVGASDDPAVAEAADLLATVVDQDIELDEDHTARIRHGVAADRVVSHSDPEMRHGRKSASRRFDGHKAHVVSDEGSEMILGVEVGPGNGSDGAAAAPLVKAVRDAGLDVDTLVGDMAYSDPEVRIAVEAAGATLVAKVPPLTNAGRFPKTDFAIDLAAHTVTCPAGAVTADARRARDHKGRAATRFVFAAPVCAACPLRVHCVKGSSPRTVVVGMHEARMAVARADQVRPETKALLRARCKVERKIAHLQAAGMRKARFYGRRKTKLQLVIAAAVVNIKRLAALGVFDTNPGSLAAA